MQYTIDELCSPQTCSLVCNQVCILQAIISMHLAAQLPLQLYHGESTAQPRALLLLLLHNTSRGQSAVVSTLQ
jgi:hypothetical protein